MTERDLEKLKEMPVPPPGRNARDAAIEAALAAFDASQLASPAGSAQAEPERLGKDSAKGNVVPLRQTETTRTPRSFRMNFSSRPTQALAASLVALVAAAPFAFERMTRSGLNFDAVSTELHGAMGHVDSTPAPMQRTPAAQPNPHEQDAARYAAAPPPPPPPSAAKPAPSDAPRDAVARAEENKVAGGGGAPGPAPAATANSTGASNGVALSDKFENIGAEERIAELGATTARKGNRKTDFIVVPDPNIPDEISRGLGGAPKDGTVVISQSPAGTSVRQDQLANGETSRDRLAKAKQSLGADDTGLNANPAYAPAASPASTPQASTTTASPASQAVATLEAGYPPHAAAKRDLDALVGGRRLESDKFAAAPATMPAQPHDSYAWMGQSDEKKAIVLEENRDKFESKEINAVKQVASEPVSTFSVDVDTASYAFVRRALNAGHLPPKDAVRVEEMINYFPYNYPAPESAEVPFKPTVSVFAAPWNPQHKLVHVAIKGYDLKSAERPRANLVLLMDVSGSMEPADRLPLIKNAFRMLVDQLQPDDTIGIVTYASGSGIALTPTRVADKWKILSAIDSLGAGGSTAGAAGIADAYRLAEANFEKRAVNRIILATDGDFNVGITDQNELKSYIERKRQSGIFLSILGVGQGNHNDALMQTLAQNGNGTAAYVDTLSEARKVLVDESSSTLFTIAKDVKVQIEWNPERIAEYRLVGYETRNLRREDFNNDRVDAGDIGSGHTVTAIYEVTPVGAPRISDDLRYGKKFAIANPDARTTAPETSAQPSRAEGNLSGELGFLKLRYKRPAEETSQLVSLPITDADRTFADTASDDVRFSTAVAAFGQILKGEPYTLGFGYDDIVNLAQGARGSDPFGYRAEFLNLVRIAKSARP